MSDSTSEGIFGDLIWWATALPAAPSKYALVRHLLEASRDFDFNFGRDGDLARKLHALGDGTSDGYEEPEWLVLVYWDDSYQEWNLWFRGHHPDHVIEDAEAREWASDWADWPAPEDDDDDAE